MKRIILTLAAAIMMLAPSAFSQEAQDIEISPRTGDIYQAYVQATSGLTVGKLTINLLSGVNYTITGQLSAQAGIVINGNGAQIDAASLTGPMIAIASKEDYSTWDTVSEITLRNLTIKGIAYQLFRSSQSKYVVDNFNIDNCFVEIAGNTSVIDCTVGSVIGRMMVKNSTFYAPEPTLRPFFTSQSGQTASQVSDTQKQYFVLKNSTFYNLAKDKNFFIHRKSGQNYLIFEATDNIFVNCGKNGQTILGLNQGQSSSLPTWIVARNAFNFDGVDTSAQETTNDAEEPIQDSVEGLVNFLGLNDGRFYIEPGQPQNVARIGDPRWIILTNKTRADVNLDGDVSIADVTQLVNILLENE